MLIGIFYIIFTTIFLLFCLLINIWHFTDLEGYPVHLHFFIRNSNILNRLSVLFLKIFSFRMFLLCSYFSRKNVYLLTAKITFDVYNCLYKFLHAIQKLGDSLHVKRTFWCLIDVVWLGSMYMSGHSFVSRSKKRYAL